MLSANTRLERFRSDRASLLLRGRGAQAQGSSAAMVLLIKAQSLMARGFLDCVSTPLRLWACEVKTGDIR